MMVYLAGPIRDMPDQGRGWRIHAAATLRSAGFLVYNPLEAYDATEANRAGEDPFARDTLALRRADVVLANLIGPVSQGTLVEMGIAYGWGKPVITVSEGLEHGFVRGVRTAEFPSVERALAWLIGVQPK